MTLPHSATGAERAAVPPYARAIRSLDAFSRMMKVPHDLRTQSTAGGAISLLSFVLIAVLFLSELLSYLTPRRSTTLSVDAGLDDTLTIFLDVNFPYVNCDLMGVDALDIGGTVQLEISNHLYKSAIHHDGTRVRDSPRSPLRRPPLSSPAGASQQSPSPSPWPHGCGSCMGAGLTGSECCNTCADVRALYEKRGWLLTDLSGIPQCVREGVTTLTSGQFDARFGCNIHGHIHISKVAGRINLTPGHSFHFHGHTLHDLSAMRDRTLDLSHRINRLWFGQPYPGQLNPLDGVAKHARNASDAMGAHEYFIRVVPTTYKWPFAKTLRTNQYSQTYFFRKSDPNRGGQLMPGVFLNYDLSPIHVEVSESRGSFFHFLVQLCAIIGGVFTVASMLSAFMDDVVLKALRKRQMGKMM